MSLAVLNDSLYVGGSFDRAGAVAVSSLAIWGGTQWSSVPGGVTHAGSAGAVTALAAFQGRLFVGGEFDSAGGIPARNIAAWGGGAWNSLGEGVHARVTCMAAHGNSLVVGLYFGSEGVLGMGRLLVALDRADELWVSGDGPVFGCRSDRRRRVPRRSP